MRLLPQYADVFSPSLTSQTGDDEAVTGLQSSLRSSAALRAILECARKRAQDRDIEKARIQQIEQICVRYEEHHKAVRDHCLDYYNIRPEVRASESVCRRTGQLMHEGKALYGELRELILAF